MNRAAAQSGRLSLGRFTALCERLSLSSTQATHVQLLDAYRERTRYYHNYVHIDACLRHLDTVRDAVPTVDEVELALWFHDAVYVPGAPENERRSADWLLGFVADSGGSSALAARLEALVMATVHPSLPSSDAERWLVDIDLAILGAPTASFARFETDIRAEYAFVPEPVYRARRRALLQAFLAAPCIYHTAYFHQLLDAAARHNLHGAIAALG